MGMTPREWMAVVLVVWILPTVMAVPWLLLVHLRQQLYVDLGDRTEAEWWTEKVWGMLLEQLAAEGQEILEHERQENPTQEETHGDAADG